jgi:hypothetical protein
MPPLTQTIRVSSANVFLQNIDWQAGCVSVGIHSQPAVIQLQVGVPRGHSIPIICQGISVRRPFFLDKRYITHR